MSRDPTAALRERLGIVHPIIQAPMGGGPTTPNLVAAVSEAGGLGSIAAGYLGPRDLAHEIEQTRRRTARPFAVNLFVDGGTDGSSDQSAMLSLLASWHDRFDLPTPSPADLPPDLLADHLEVIVDASVAVVSFTFGIPDPVVVARLKSTGAFLIGTATSVAEARAVEKAGLDAVVVQGAEAGAHRAAFLPPYDGRSIGLIALVPQVVDAVQIPVIAAGGIMDGRGVAAALALGAAAAQMGTAFLLCDEAGTHPTYRNALLASGAADTVITRAFSGRPARAIRNEFIDGVESSGVGIPPYPVQNTLTGPLRRAAAAAGDARAVALWAGQGFPLVRETRAGDLVREVAAEAAHVLSRTRSAFSAPTGADR